MSSWSFNLRTKVQRTDSNSSASSSSSSPTPFTSSPARNPSSETELWNDLDFSRREEPECVPEYKPNPFSIARINAATRRMQQDREETKPRPEKRKRADVDEEEKGTIVHAFKRQKQEKGKPVAKFEEESSVVSSREPDPKEPQICATINTGPRPLDTKPTRSRPPAPVSKACPPQPGVSPIATCSSSSSGPHGLAPVIARQVFNPAKLKPQASPARFSASPLASSPATTRFFLSTPGKSGQFHKVQHAHVFTPTRFSNSTPDRMPASATSPDPHSRSQAHTQINTRPHVSAQLPVPEPIVSSPPNVSVRTMHQVDSTSAMAASAVSYHSHPRTQAHAHNSRSRAFAQQEPQPQFPSPSPELGHAPSPPPVVTLLTLPVPSVDPASPTNRVRKCLRPTSPAQPMASSSSPVRSSPPRKRWRITTVAQQEEDAEWSTLPTKKKKDTPDRSSGRFSLGWLRK
ncbi:hypothetical protein V5O48_001903 [Marasmius crinis-equi]|uniref:Uncharacterized protein n=1 Tax=Marasmius crinis-equi TaxID=585013 RepID=A0ABR3FX98_9AGAR